MSNLETSIEVLEQAKELTANGKHKESLSLLCKCLDSLRDENTLSNRCFVASFLFNELYSLSTVYEKAFIKMRQLKDTLRSKVFADSGEPEPLDMFELVCLNNALGDSQSIRNDFRQLAIDKPEFAKNCAYYCRDCLMIGGLFDIAEIARIDIVNEIRSRLTWYKGPLEKLKGKFSNEVVSLTQHILTDQLIDIAKMASAYYRDKNEPQKSQNLLALINEIR